jgi:hypothetical protein
VLDTWFEQEVKPRLRGRAVLVRFADDALLAFAREDDARRVLEVLPKRFGLTLHPETTRLVDFRSPARTRLVGLQTLAEALPPPARARGPQCLRHVANVQAEEPDALTRTSGSVGAAGEQSPAATWPLKRGNFSFMHVTSFLARSEPR